MLYLVLYDDSDQGLCLPMGFDPEVPDTLIACDRPLALFPTRAAAQQAIRVSKAYARLQQARGKPFNSDFTDGARYVRIVDGDRYVRIVPDCLTV